MDRDEAQQIAIEVVKRERRAFGWTAFVSGGMSILGVVFVAGMLRADVEQGAATNKRQDQQIDEMRQIIPALQTDIRYIRRSVDELAQYRDANRAAIEDISRTLNTIETMIERRQHTGDQRGGL